MLATSNSVFWGASVPPNHLSSHVPPLSQDCVFGQYSVRCILDQDVLLQEDVELIELLDPSLLTLGSSPSGSSGRASALPRPGLIARPSLWYVVRKETHRAVQRMGKIIGPAENIIPVQHQQKLKIKTIVIS